MIFKRISALLHIWKINQIEDKTVVFSFYESLNLMAKSIYRWYDSDAIKLWIQSEVMPE